jgi:hypothetical protein
MSASRVPSRTHYVCINAEHAAGNLDHGHFTMKSGTWGYCASPTPVVGHEWAAVDSVLHGSPREMGRRISALRSSSPPSLGAGAAAEP